MSSGTLLVSLAALVVGNLLGIWALVSLGRCFGVFPAVRGLVTHGPYRFVRHPLYVAEAIVIFGFLFARLSPAMVVIFGMGMALQAWRAVQEERALARVFPEYVDYRQDTGRFLPRFH
jgi:protein-S-isoprenylcysteine O-methyltransferase Ste14